MIFILLVFISSKVFSQSCVPNDCIIPVKKGCESYCKERVIKYSDISELKEFGYSEDDIKNIYKFRQENEGYKDFDRKTTKRYYGLMFIDDGDDLFDNQLDINKDKK